jgi:hypothetical protein
MGDNQMGEVDMEQEDEDAIRAKAYELWLSDGQPHGRDLHHWHTAREQLLSEQNGEGMSETETLAEPGPAKVAPKKAAA